MVTDEKERPELNLVEDVSQEIRDAKELDLNAASEGTLWEHNIDTWTAVKIYWRGILWCMLYSLAIIMRAFDIEILGNFYALPSFQNRFGSPVPGKPEAGNQIPAKWQTAIGYGSAVGQLIGGYLTTYPMERYGRIKPMMVYLVATTGLVFMQFFAQSIEMLTAAEFIAGVIWGGYPLLVQTYDSEILPLKLRQFLTGYINLCYVIGQFISTGITTGFATRLDQWAYRVPFALQWLWPLLMLPLLFFAPESPWWLVRQGRFDDARKALARTADPEKVDFEKTMAMMIKTDMVEKEIQEGTRYRECFKGSNRRRTEICLCLCVVNNFIGNPVGYASYLFEQVGLDSQQSFDMGVGVNGIGFVATICAIPLLLYVGHRRIFLLGLGSSIAILWTVALLCFAKDYNTNQGYAWAQASMLILLQFIQQPCLNTMNYVILCEMPSTRLRSKTLSLTVMLGAVVGLVTTPIGPYLLNPGAAGAGAKIEFLYGGCCIISFIYCFFRLPEVTGRTFEEIDLLFERKVKTRDFKKYKFDVHPHDEQQQVDV